MYSWNKWDDRFLCLAGVVRHWSKDPSTKVGAVIADGKRVVSMGYNGFPKGVLDLEELYANREEKLERIVHAEINAILYANESLVGKTLYTFPFQCCARCAAQVIQSGIKRVVAPQSIDTKWKNSFLIANQMFREAKVEVELV